MTRGPTPKEYFEREFAARKKQWNESEYLPALFEVVQLASLARIALPEWAAVAVLNLIRDRWDAPAPGKRGRSKSPKGQNRLRYKHQQCHDILEFVFKLHGIDYVKKPGRPGKDHPSIKAAREEAAEWLRKSIGRVSPENVQKAYDRIESEAKDRLLLRKPAVKSKY
jgi:hypothetical protein